MANTIPCPNPACTHDFNVAEVQAASELACPKCGFHMQGRAASAPKPAPAATPAPSPKPKAKPAKQAPAQAQAVPSNPLPPSAPEPTLPVATPVVTAVEPEAALAAPTPAAGDSLLDFPEPGEGTGAVVRADRPSPKTTWRTIITYALVAGLALCFVTSAIVGVVWIYLGTGGLRAFSQAEGDAVFGKIRNSKNETETVFKLILPKGEKNSDTWIYDGELLANFRDDETRGALATAWRNEDYQGEFWFALVARDYGSQRPRDSEMLRTTTEKLENLFGPDVSTADKVESAKFKNMPAQRLGFQGVIKEVRWNGECYMFFHNGIAYWLFMAATKNDVLAHFVDIVPKNHVYIVSERRGWTPQLPPRETFSSVDGRIELTAPKGVWIAGDAKAEDAAGHMLLTGVFKHQKDNTKNAHLFIFALPKAESLDAAIKAAREHREEKDKSTNANFKLVDAPEMVPDKEKAEANRDIGSPPKRGRIVDLKLVFQAEAQRYFLLAVVNEPDATYAIMCDCDWKSRQIWRQDFLDLLATVKFK
ncbi:MAG: hypothetical protein FJ303_23565 [Planctomycetes bacterium]|nr:hypothetical protein [Planctomycetota bacterium]